ncbi:MAG TPA: hypothetical protein VD862_03600 [Candidatus Paceibacterota bacterium]|nr:hypothetical protein [Candidatus Paceibacterota bacterium]
MKRVVSGLSWTLVVIVLMVALIGGIAAVQSRVEFPGKAAAIEQLRADAALICASQAEQVYAQVTAANQEIAYWRAYNDHWLTDPFVTDGWNLLEPIAITDSPICVDIP